MSRKKTNFTGPERPFAKVDLEHVRNLLKQGEGWVGFSTPYSQVLRPFFLDDEGKSETNYTLVDFGCGWGEHVILAGIGYPSMGVPKVKKAVGISADARDIETAKLLYEFARADPTYFRNVLVSSDVGIHVGFLSDLVSDMKTVFSSTELSETLRQILQSNDTDNLDSFMNKHMHTNGKDQYRQRLNGADIEFKHMDLFNPDLPDNFADSVLSSSVSSYIANPRNEASMWKHILRICKAGATINAISFPYEREGKLTCAAEELAIVAEKYHVNLRVRQVRNHGSDPPETAHKQTIFTVVDKPEFIDYRRPRIISEAELQQRLESARASKVETSCIGNSLYLAGIVPELAYVQPPTSDFLNSKIFEKIDEPELGCIVASMMNFGNHPTKKAVVNFGVVMQILPTRLIAFRDEYQSPVRVQTLDEYLQLENPQYSVKFYRPVERFNSIKDIVAKYGPLLAHNG